MISNSIIDMGKFASTPNYNDDLYIWADYCEIACLMANERNLSDEEIYRSYYYSRDLEPEDVNQYSKDKFIGLIRDTLRQIDIRDYLLESKYPFYFNEDEMTINLKKDLNFEQQIYIVLLCASNLKYVVKNQMNTLTSSFESISLYTMRQILPQATIKLFGSSNIDKLLATDRFSSPKLKDRIVELSNEIHQRYRPEELNMIKDRDVGDGGLDIVGYINLKDDRSSHPLFFAQCACSKESWIDKQNSTSRSQWEKYLAITDTSIHNFILVPFMYMDNEKNWTDSLKITRNVMIDRLRIMNLITKDSPFNTLALDVLKKDLEITA